jgi:putative ATP-dependent endonuclease of OLD family
VIFRRSCCNKLTVRAKSQGDSSAAAKAGIDPAMKLKSLSVKNFRSYTNGNGEPPHRLALGDGLNLLVGPNNCGKSNLLRAVALALQDSGGTDFTSEHDIPSQMAWAYPSIALDLTSNGKTSVEKTLLGILDEYETSAGARKTHAENGDICLRVTYRKDARDVFFSVKGKSIKGSPELLERAMAQFKKSIRFIYLRSGESLNNFLSGTFRELLHTVRQEHLSGELEKARKNRDEFIDKLKGELLEPLGKHVRDELKLVMPEIESVTVNPLVPALEDILAGAEITVKDSAETALLNKGTGVRGALLVGLLAYLAKHSRRSLVLAVEEPESFLHPRAQQELRDNLLAIAKRPDVSLIVTTHSPFMLSRSQGTLITSLSKTPDGRSLIGAQIRGDEPHSPVVAPLFGEAITPALLDLVKPPKDGTQAVLVVEGFTDKAYIEKSLQLMGRLELLEGIDIKYDEGAHKAAVQAVLVKQMTAGLKIPVGVLFDFDEHGRSAKQLLTDKFKWNGGHVFLYSRWKKDGSSIPVEAEDMFDEGFLERFVRDHPPHLVAEKAQYKTGGFHYGFTQEGKEAFLAFLVSSLTAKDTGLWVQVMEDVRKGLGVIDKSGAVISTGGARKSASATPNEKT